MGICDLIRNPTQGFQRVLQSFPQRKFPQSKNSDPLPYLLNAKARAGHCQSKEDGMILRTVATVGISSCLSSAMAGSYRLLQGTLEISGVLLRNPPGLVAIHSLYRKDPNKTKDKLSLNRTMEASTLLVLSLLNSYLSHDYMSYSLNS